jgi:ABC-2 type transport system ATP-binding protein
VSYDGNVTDTNNLLRSILELDVPIIGFTEDKRHLNDAFMDLTTKGVK